MSTHLTQWTEGILLTCSDELRWALRSHTGPAGGGDGDVVLHGTTQGAEGAACVASAVVPLAVRAKRRGGVQHPGHAAAPGDRDHVSGAVHQHVEAQRGAGS